MRITLLPSCCAPGGRHVQLFTTYLVNGTLAIDAGSLGFALAPEDQGNVREILLTHSHADHLASLPVHIDVALGLRGPPILVRGSAAVLDSLRRDLFNDRVWPDYPSLHRGGVPLVRLEELRPETPIIHEGIQITPIEVDHTVPTLGFILDDGAASIVISSDTGPTQALWQRAGRMPNLRAVFLECSFPDELAGIAQLSCHLTPALFAAELRKLARPAPVFAVHLKARYHARVAAELAALGIPGLEVVEPGRTYEF